MITIPETIVPKASYNNLIKHPLTKEIFMGTLSKLWIQGETKDRLIKEFTSTIKEFKDFSYTGDVDEFKPTLYTTLSDTPREPNLFDVLSTEEFVKNSTWAIENNISIWLTNTDKNVSLKKYINITRKRKERQRRRNIIHALRWLYSFDEERKIHRDTAELIAALKKHLVLHTTNDSTIKFSALVENNKQTEIAREKDRVHYGTIENYTYFLDRKRGPREDHHIKNIAEVEESLKYLMNSDGYDKEKLDKVMHHFIDKLVKYWLSKYAIQYHRTALDLIKKLEINDLKTLLNHNNEHKEHFMTMVNNEKIRLQKDIVEWEIRVKNFYRPSREERCRNAPFRWAPIKSDNEYSNQLDYKKLYINMNKKNLELMESYIVTLNG